MCCNPVGGDRIPPVVQQMLADYRRLQRDNGWDWGLDWQLDPRGVFEAIPCQLPVALARLVVGQPPITDLRHAKLGQDEALRRCLIGNSPPAGTTFITIGAKRELEIRTGQPLPAVESDRTTHWLVLDSRTDRSVRVEAADRSISVAPHALVVVPTLVEPPRNDTTLFVNGVPVIIQDAVRRVGAATLRLISETPARWSIVDDHLGAHFPVGKLPKWDSQFRPYFHGQSIEIVVPAVQLTVTVARGIEWEAATVVVQPDPGSSHEITVSPRRWIDPNVAGWYSADLHVHSHYSGDLVVAPEDAACMQVGEGLNLMSLLAANLFTTRIYDREAFEALAGADLYWSTDTYVARYGIEYRNDLLGHFHALAPSGPPTRYQTGHVQAAEQEDWPPNSVACIEQHALGATVGYAHPVWMPFAASGAPDSVFEPGVFGERTVEARELVVDAALGLVDSLDLLHYGDWVASAQLYYHLLGCGIRLAVSVGTDVFLSISHGLNSDPPGWARMYAYLGDEPLTAQAYKSAIRAGRTIATNGPWLSLAVSGWGPGAVLDARPGDAFELEAECLGAGVQGLEIVGPHGTIARAAADREHATIRTTHIVDGPMWIAARAIGGQHPDILRGPAYAHTSPVYLDVEGRRVGRTEDARWCLDWIDRLERLVNQHGRYRSSAHREDVLRVVQQARAFYREVEARGDR